MAPALTIHMIANAHLDPVWLWQWQRGADEALATCRSACDILDDYPEVRFTRGEAWVYDWVRRMDPVLFERIRAHITAGRWEVVNGWWVQPDLNLPTEEAILQTARLGRAWMRKYLGLTEIPVAYNVDSFGQGAFLPRMIRQGGQRYYVMMRPDASEHPLPSPIFRWRSPDGAEVLTYRITGFYAWWGVAAGYDLSWKLDEVIKSAPEGAGHMAAFYGVGNHGGGLTRAAIEWIQAHREYKPGVRLEFSTLKRFFDAVEPGRNLFPVVTGELQMHAVGCYSVCGALKREIHAAELAAIDAGGLVRRRGFKAPRVSRQGLAEAWRTICFNQFHDILPGSSIADAVETQRAQVGGIRSRLEEIVYETLRHPESKPRQDKIEGHRIHIVNRVARPWRGLVEADLWISGHKWAHHLADEQGRLVPSQHIESPAMMVWEEGHGIPPRLLLPLDLAKNQNRILRIVSGNRDAEAAAAMDGSAPVFKDGVLSNDRVAVRFGASGVESVRALPEDVNLLNAPPALQCIEDYSDTWSHGLDRFGGPVVAEARFEAPRSVEAGCLLAMVRLDGTIGESIIRLFVWLERGDPSVHFRVTTNYRERYSVLKARFAPAGGIAARRDRVAGGWLERNPDGREYPIQHALAWRSGTRSLGLALPDTFALDGTAEAVRLTLIRNSINAMDGGNREKLLAHPRQVERFGTDEGPQSLRFSLSWDDAAKPKALEGLVDCRQRPPWLWDDYCGISRVYQFEK